MVNFNLPCHQSTLCPSVLCPLPGVNVVIYFMCVLSVIFMQMQVHLNIHYYCPCPLAKKEAHYVHILKLFT